MFDRVEFGAVSGEKAEHKMLAVEADGFVPAKPHQAVQ
jgi:hypothetical protein